MYEELVKELRNTERICRDRMDGEVMLKAADAIEKLANWWSMAKTLGDMVMPKWIPVTEHEQILKVLKTERECVSRDCDRDCAHCDLSLEQDEVLSVYDMLIMLFADTEKEKAE